MSALLRSSSLTGEDVAAGDVVFGQPHGDAVGIGWVGGGRGGGEMVPVCAPGYRLDLDRQAVVLLFEPFLERFDRGAVSCREGLPVGEGSGLRLRAEGFWRPSGPLRAAGVGEYRRRVRRRPGRRRRVGGVDGGSIFCRSFGASPCGGGRKLVNNGAHPSGCATVCRA